MGKNITIVYKSRIPELNALAKARATQAVRESTMRINARAKLAMAAPHSGEVYGRHIASKPGEAPAVDTGNLMNSLQETYPNATTGIAFTNVEYAAPLEYGTARVKPRPFYTPAAKAERPLFIAALRKTYK